MSSYIATGLDIGTASIRVAVCEIKPNHKPKVLALASRPSRGLRRGYILQFDEAVESIKETIKEAERQSGLKIKKVYAGIGGINLESKAVDGSIILPQADQEIKEVDIRKAIEASTANLPDAINKTVIHHIPIGFKVDSKKIMGRPEGIYGSKLEAKTVLVYSSSHHLKDLITAIETAGLQIEDIIASPLAAGYAVLNKIQKNAGCVLVNIGSQTTSIVVFEEGIPVSLQVFPIGSTDITNDIALGFKIPLEDAERIKLGESDSNSPKKKLEEIIEARLSDIFEFIENHLKKMGRNGLLPAGVIMTGGGSGIDNMEKLAMQYFDLPAQIALPTVSANSRNQITDPAWSVAYGLCLFSQEADGEESMGIKIAKNTGLNIVKWLKELMP
ncbi:MAG: cell division protein FtsA [Patescibacteria group bacterium]